MVMLLAVATIGLWGAIATIECVGRDGYRRVPTDPSPDRR
jgi:hypothetical protein